MSKRSNRQKSSPGAADGKGGTMTVMDGNAVGVAPSGEAAADTADELDAEILALLADDTTPAEPVAVSDPEPVEEGAEEVVAETTDDVHVEIEPGDEDVILAELEGSSEATPPATSTKSTKKSEPKTPAAPTRSFTDIAAIDPAAFKTNLDGSSAKKVNEKVGNLVQAIERGSKLSRYTAVAVKKLIADGKVSGKSLVETFESEGLKIGTARAQSQQMTALFKITGLAQPAADNPRELVLADTNLAKELELLAA